MGQSLWILFRGGRRWQRQQEKLNVLVGCRMAESLTIDSAQAAAVSAENQQYL